MPIYNYSEEKEPLFGALPSKMNSRKEDQEGKQPVKGQDQYLPLQINDTKPSIVVPKTFEHKFMY